MNANLIRTKAEKKAITKAKRTLPDKLKKCPKCEDRGYVQYSDGVGYCDECADWELPSMLRASFRGYWNQ